MKTLNKGFTLIELLVVIAIIGLLSTIVVASLTSTRAKARDATRVASLNEMAKAVNILDKDPAFQLLGCTSVTRADVIGCTTPDLSKYKDPSTPGTACGATPTATCQYSITRVSVPGTAGQPTTQDWAICSWLEQGAGALPSGPVHVGSDTTGAVIAGCL